MTHLSANIVKFWQTSKNNLSKKIIQKVSPKFNSQKGCNQSNTTMNNMIAHIWNVEKITKKHWIFFFTIIRQTHHLRSWSSKIKLVSLTITNQIISIVKKLSKKSKRRLWRTSIHKYQNLACCYQRSVWQEASSRMHLKMSINLKIFWERSS